MSQIIINGLFVGSFYALIALGYSMVYGIIKLLNFAHGDVYMIGAFVGFVLLTSFGGLAAAATIPTLVLLVLVAMIFTGLLGVTIERVAYRPLRSSPRLAVLITAVGMSFTLEYAVRQIFGPSPKSYPVRVSGGSVELIGARISTAQLVLMALAALLTFIVRPLLVGHDQDDVEELGVRDPRGVVRGEGRKVIMGRLEVPHHGEEEAAIVEWKVLGEDVIGSNGDAEPDR